jgi:hypothetical protein
LLVPQPLKGNGLGLGFDTRVGMAVVRDRLSASDRLLKQQSVVWERVLE